MNTSSLNSLISDYPYFIAPLLDELNTCRDPQQRAWLKTRLAVNVGSPLALREIFGLDSESLVDFYGENDTHTPSTEDAIETFLNTFGKNSTSIPDTTPDLPMAEIIPNVDATAAIAEKQPINDIPADDTASRINAFLEAVPPKIPRTRHPQPTPTQPTPGIISEDTEETEAIGNASLTEGLVRIMIKNGNFSKALDIITQLNLKNTEKSIYFADQIRFLRKLIANKEKK
ncbi:MAG: hypothetical protein NC097_01950 [Clostridium sp.]|nr:hypothetical protein [Prevotella sp.]MCM1428540.1 hypothetical protein [Clostridium sp.]MCM1475004.1 hypothetical protein [Muribaculaceae bacterium]